MRRVRCLGAVLVASMALMAWAGPAAAPVDPDGHHWGPFRWGLVTHPTRYFFVYDRAADPAVSAATKQMVTALDNLWHSFPGLPYPIYLADHANNGVCAQFTRPDAAFMTMCSGNPSDNQIASIEYGMTFEDHVVNPAVVVEAGLDANTAFTTVCGMLGRAMGLNDNPDPASCLHPVVTLGQLHGFTGTDLLDLLGIYYSHYPG